MKNGNRTIMQEIRSGASGWWPVYDWEQRKSNNDMKKNEPVKDKAEAEKVWEYLVNVAIRESGILKRLGSPDEQPFQIGVDVAMQIPQIVNEEYMKALKQAKEALEASRFNLYEPERKRKEALETINKLGL